MSSNPDFDRWYAARKTRILVSPSHQLETFGLVITPRLFSELTTEGLGDEAKAYLEFLKETEEHLRILRYGYHLKSDNFSEQIVTDSLAAVTERVKAAVKASNDSFAAVLQGVDDPWDVALVVLWRHEVERSAGRNIKELNEKGKLF